MTDESLMKSIQDGETKDLGVLYEKYKRALFSYFVHLHQSAFVAEDLVQNVFERVLKYKHQFKGDGNLRSWIFQIARNVSSDHYRKEKKHRADDIHNHAEIISKTLTPYQGAENEDKKNHLYQALSQLSADKREVLILVKLGEMKYREVADLLGVNESTIKVKTFRAIKELREIMIHQNIMTYYE